MFATTVGLLFLAGAKIWQFLGLALTGVAAVAALIAVEPYRIRRVVGFLDPGRTRLILDISLRNLSWPGARQLGRRRAWQYLRRNFTGSAHRFYHVHCC